MLSLTAALCYVLMRFNDAYVNKFPLKTWILNKELNIFINLFLKTIGYIVDGLQSIGHKKMEGYARALIFLYDIKSLLLFFSYCICHQSHVRAL